jgi:hypothetical protein
MISFPHRGKIYSWGDGPKIGIPGDELLLLFKIKKISDLEFLKSYAHYQELQKKVNNILNSFSNFPINLEPYDAWTLVPTQIVEAYNSSLEALYGEAVDWFSKLVANKDFDKVEEFFDKVFPKDVLSKLESYQINVENNPAEVSLKYAENFRFKSDHGFFNLFNLPKVDRHKVLPKSEDEFIFMADFRQFEFRSFLDLQGITDFFKESDLYEQLGKSLNMNKKDLKVAIISYLYGSKFNDKLEGFFQKNRLINSTKENSIYWFKDMPVFIGENVEPGKKIHTIVQTISQYNYIVKLKKVFELLEGKKTSFMFPLHDAMIFSMHNDEIELIEEIVSMLEDDVYRVKCYVGPNLLEAEVKEV